MKLICEKPSDFFAVKMAADVSAKYGFVAICVNDIGQCYIVPPHEVYALSKKQSEEIENKINRLRERAKK